MPLPRREVTDAQSPGRPSPATQYGTAVAPLLAGSCAGWAGAAFARALRFGHRERCRPDGGAWRRFLRVRQRCMAEDDRDPTRGGSLDGSKRDRRPHPPAARGGPRHRWQFVPTHARPQSGRLPLRPPEPVGHRGQGGFSSRADPVADRPGPRHPDAHAPAREHRARRRGSAQRRHLCLGVCAWSVGRAQHPRRAGLWSLPRAGRSRAWRSRPLPEPAGRCRRGAPALPAVCRPHADARGLRPRGSACGVDPCSRNGPREHSGHDSGVGGRP